MYCLSTYICKSFWHCFRLYLISPSSQLDSLILLLLLGNLLLASNVHYFQTYLSGLHPFCQRCSFATYMNKNYLDIDYKHRKHIRSKPIRFLRRGIVCRSGCSLCFLPELCSLASLPRRTFWADEKSLYEVGLQGRELMGAFSSDLSLAGKTVLELRIKSFKEAEPTESPVFRDLKIPKSRCMKVCWMSLTPRSLGGGWMARLGIVPREDR